MLDAGVSVEERVAALEALHPLTADARLAAAVEWRRVAGMALARSLAELAALAREPVAGDALEGILLAGAELAAAVPMSRSTAEAEVDLALQLTGTLRATLGALRDGVIDLPRAKVIARGFGEVPELSAAERAEVERRVLARAVSRTPAHVRRDLQRELLAVDPAAAQKRHEKRVAERGVRVEPAPDGTGYVVAHLSSDGVAVVDTCLDAMADARRDWCLVHGVDPGLHQQRRADALVGLARATLEGRKLPLGTAGLPQWWVPPVLPRRHGRRPHLVVAAAASTLAGADDAPADLAGYGPIPAAVARRVAEEAGSAQVACLDDSTGRCRWVGVRTRYEPNQAQRDHVIARDRRCRHPHCRRPATQCDLDHVQPHGARGGATCPCNLIALCRFHHGLKTRGHWTVWPLDPVLGAAGPLRWTSRLGRTYDEENAADHVAPAGRHGSSTPSARGVPP